MDNVNPTLASPDIFPCNSEINQSTSSKVCDEKQPMSVKSSPDLEYTEVNGHSKNLSTDQVLPGRFLDVESLCELLKNETVTVSTIPKGVKEHVYFVVSNGKNIAKRNRGEKSNFEGDCGVWLSKASSTKKNYFIV